MIKYHTFTLTRRITVMSNQTAKLSTNFCHSLEVYFLTSQRWIESNSHENEYWYIFQVVELLYDVQQRLAFVIEIYDFIMRHKFRIKKTSTSIVFAFLEIIHLNSTNVRWSCKEYLLPMPTNCSVLVPCASWNCLTII